VRLLPSVRLSGVPFRYPARAMQRSQAQQAAVCSSEAGRMRWAAEAPPFGLRPASIAPQWMAAALLRMYVLPPPCSARAWCSRCGEAGHKWGGEAGALKAMWACTAPWMASEAEEGWISGQRPKVRPAVKGDLHSATVGHR
jgi:hypothetical protein